MSEKFTGVIAGTGKYTYLSYLGILLMQTSSAASLKCWVNH
jgi:hypothetical protein